MFKKVLLNLVVGVGGILTAVAILQLSGFQSNYEVAALETKYLDMYSQNNILFYDPNDCLDPNNGIFNVDSSFRIDSSVDPMDQWYAEGCIDNGTCTGHKYYGGVQDVGGVMRIPMVVAQANPGLLERDTMTDDSFGGMQYIYAENYDIQFNAFNGWMTTFTKKPGANSTRKYYWIVLPDRAYMSVAGDTYVATFENLDEPVYFIALDAHACEHQSERYCERAAADPDGVTIGKQFLGAFTISGGDYTEVAHITGKLTSLHRINGRGEVLANEVKGNTIIMGGGESNSNSSVSKAQQIVDKAKELSWPVGDSHVKTYVGNAAYDEAAKKRGGYFVNKFNEEEVTSSSDVVYSCARFVSMVLLESNADPDFANDPDRIHENGLHMIGKKPGQLAYYLKNSPNWGEVAGYDGHGYDLLKPGDILINSPGYLDGNGSSFTHTFIYLGNGIQAEGNNGLWAPSQFAWEGDGYRAFRLKDSGGCTSYNEKYPQYWQYDYANSDHENSSRDWAENTDVNIYNGGYISNSGCGPTSMAMLATVASGQDVYPQDVIDITSPTGCYVYKSPTVLDPLVGDKYGFEVIAETYSSKADAYDKIKKYLNDGYMIHLSGDGCHDGFASPKEDGSCTDGHYIGIFSIDSNDKVQVANSAYMGNSQVDLQSIIDAIHNGVFTAIRGGGSGSSGKCSGICSAKSETNKGNSDVLKSVEEIIELAQKNGSTYTWGGGHNSSEFDSMLSGAPINVDCTGFASLVMYKTFGETNTFSSSEILGGMSEYEEVQRSDVRPGDIFAYSSPSGHGGIVIEASNGVVTKIAETGGPEGIGGANNNIGYSGSDSFSVKNMNTENGHFFRWKGKK